MYSSSSAASFDQTGLILMFIAYFLIIVVVLTYPFFWKRALKIYWVWVGFGLFFLAYMLAARFIPNIIQLINGDYKHFPNPETDTSPSGTSGLGIDKSISDVLLLDMCPFMGILIPILFIVDKKRVFLNAIAPWALFGGMLSIFGITFSDFQNGTEPAVWTWKFIFVGYDQDRLFYLMHLFLMFEGTIVLLDVIYKKNIFKHILDSFIWFLLYAIYVIILAYSFGVKEHAFGVVKNDWQPNLGEFGSVGAVLGMPDNLWYVSMIIGFVLANAIATTFLLTSWLLKKWKIYKPIDGDYVYKKTQISQMWRTNHFHWR